MFIPHDELNPETLHALIEEFITREGAVHGHEDTPLSTMVAQVRRQLKSGKVAIAYDEATETCTIIPVDRAGGPRRDQDPGR